MSYYYFSSSRWGHLDPKEMTNFPKYLQWGPEPADNPTNLAQDAMNFTAVP